MENHVKTFLKIKENKHELNLVKYNGRDVRWELRLN
jgi:hypothetical protein